MNKKAFNKKTVILLLLALACLLVGAILIINAQAYGVRADFETESVTFVQTVSESIKGRERDIQKLDDYNKTVSADLIYNITFIYDGTDFPHLNWAEREKYSPANVCDMEAFNLESLHICGADGTIWLSDDNSLLLKNIVDEGILTAADLASFSEDACMGTYKLRYDDDGQPYSVVEPVEGYANGYKARYYAVRVIGKNEDEVYFAIGADRSDLEDKIKESYSDLGAYFDTIVNYDGFSAFAVNTDTGIIEYASPYDKELMGRLASDVGLSDIDQYDDGQFHKVKINGAGRKVFVKCNDAGIVGRYAVVAADIGVDGPLRTAVMACIVLLVIIIFLLIVAGFRLTKTRRKHLVKEYIACVIACIVLTGIVSTYISTISSISQAMLQCEVNGDTFAHYYKSGRDNAQNMSNFYRTKRVSVLKSIATYLQQNQAEMTEEDNKEVYEYYNKDDKGNKEYILDSSGNVTRSIANNEMLDSISIDEEYKELYVINSMGNTVMTGGDNWYYTITDGKSGYDDELNSVLERKAKDFYDYVLNEDSGYEIIAVPIELYVSGDGEGNTCYHNEKKYYLDNDGSIKLEYGLLVAVSDTTTDLRLSMESIPREMLSSMKAAEGVELAVTDKTDDGHRLVLYTDGLGEEDLTEMAIPESYYLSNNYKFANVNNKSCMLGVSCLSGMKDMNMITMMDEADIQSQRWKIVIASMVAVLLAGVAFIVYFTKAFVNDDEEYDDDIRKDIYGSYEDPQNNYSWNKFYTAIGFILLLVLVSVYAFINGNGYLRFMEYVVSVKWEKGFHIFSLSYFIYLIILVLVIITIAREFVHLLAPVLNSGAETVLRLLLSLVQYGCIIACIFYAMYLFGFQMGTVVTGAGILTIVIGLGANSLIGDIVAGLFIIFEHEYQVGNWITVGDFTGIVRAIGLRTTKVENTSGNVKTFNNSTISSVTNLTDNDTTVRFCISIGNDIPMQRVDELVVTKLRERTAYCKEITGGPMPGIMEKKPDYTGGYYYYAVETRCEQKNIRIVKNTVFAEFVELLKEEHIPFL